MSPSLPRRSPLSARNSRSAERPTRRLARRLVLPVALLSCALMAACGSQIDPATVAAASGGGSGTAAGSGTSTQTGTDGDVAAGGVPLISDDGSGAVAGAPAAGDTGGGTTAAGGTTGTTGGTAAGGTAGAKTPAGTKGDKGTKGGADSAATSATSGTAAGSCDGFNNSQPGVSATEIRVGNASDISGPIPGLFKSAQQATQAYMAYFNATSSICGHKIVVDALDSRTDASADQQAYAKACTGDFATVGSQSAFDSGGAATAQGCGLPDLRSYSLSSARTNCTTCYAAYGVRPNQVPTAVPAYWNQAQPDAVKHVGMLYINAGASPENAMNFKAAWEKNGWNFDVFQSTQTSDFDFTTYVQQMKNAGVQFVVYVGPYQQTVKLQQAMKAQSFVPKVFLQDATIYDKGYTDLAGSLAEGTYVYSQVALLDDLTNPEVKLYRTWLQQVAPGATPNIYGAYAWSAARLFTAQATALGGKLTRATLLASLATVKDWTSNGLHVKQNVGGKVSADCISIIQYSGGAWKRVTPDYLCNGLTTN